MNAQITIAIIGAIPALITAAVSILISNRVLGIKIDELSRRVEKHNQIVERTFRLEEKTVTLFNDMSEVKTELHDLRDKI